LLRLLAMLFVFAAFTVVLVVGLSTWTFGEVTEITGHHDRHRTSEITNCVASVRYEVDGRLYRSRDSSQISGHRPTSECPFEVGQTAIVLYTEQHPEMGRSFTSTGNSWFALLALLLVAPLFGYANAQRARHGLR
jgi:hypothetical protein